MVKYVQMIRISVWIQDDTQTYELWQWFHMMITYFYSSIRRGSFSYEDKNKRHGDINKSRKTQYYLEKYIRKY